MAFTPEDGTGLSTANAYVDTAFADAYFADRGVTDWTGTPEDKQSWIIRATDYIDARFGAVLIDQIAFPGIQALQFPRVKVGTTATPPVSLPVNLKKAACEYALRAKTSPLAPDPVIDPSGFKVEKTHKKVGPIEKDVTFASQGPNASMVLLKPYPAADMLMRDLIRLTQGKVIRN